MKELIRHIEALLLDNDCVILPNFGGFITNHAEARLAEEENTYLPPYRSIGFNAQLKINDGLLVQSYMITHDATYPEATRLVDAAIDELSEKLYKEGEVEFNGIGTLQRTITGEYHFTPLENGVITPQLYGLGAVHLPLLSELPQHESIAIPIKLESVNSAEIPAVTIEEPAKPEEIFIDDQKQKSHVTIRIRRDWLTNVASIAAAILLFFFLSTPAGNTYIEEEHYASLGNIDLFEQVQHESMVTTLSETSRTIKVETSKPVATKNIVSTQKATTVPEQAAQPHKANKETTKPLTLQKENTPKEVEVKKEVSTPQTANNTLTVSPKVEKKKATKIYNVIVASVASEEDAQKAIQRFNEQGHKGAYLITGNGRFRIALASYENEAEAYKKATEFNNNKEFNGAWVLTTRQ